MIHFQSKTHIVGWLINNCPRTAIVRALNEGQVEFFGGFSKIPPTTWPGWMLRVTSIHNRTWYVALIAYRDHYGIRILSDVPWGNWIGTNFWDDNKFKINLFSGDHSAEYLELRRIWNENKR